MKLLQNERIIAQTSDATLTLTTHRVRLAQLTSGRSKIIGITLDAVASCGIATVSYPLLLVLGGGLVFIGLAAMFSGAFGPGVPAFVFGLICVVTYVLTRRAVLAVASAGETIAVEAKGMSSQGLLDFIESVERCKLELTSRR